MTPKEVLIKAKALIDTPEKWCQGEFRHGPARCARAAVCDTGAFFCERNAAEAVLRSTNPTGFVTPYNDSKSTTHAGVMAWFDRAIQAAES
jgi:hypothetical protein